MDDSDNVNSVFISVKYVCKFIIYIFPLILITEGYFRTDASTENICQCNDVKHIK